MRPARRTDLALYVDQALAVLLQAALDAPACQLVAQQCAHSHQEGRQGGRELLVQGIAL